MPSREFRRAKRRKGESKDNIVEKKRERHPLLYAFSVAILVIIVVTFVGTPAVRNRFGAGGKVVFGSYKGTPIEFYPGNYFSERKDLIAEQVRQAGEKEDLEIQAYQVWRSAFEQTVLHTAMLIEAKASGVWVSENRVDKALITSGPYVVGGIFSEERYKATPSAERYAYRKLFREQIIHEQFLTDIFHKQRYSQKELEFFKAVTADQRKFSFVSFPFAEYPESEIKAYAEKNKEKFRRIKLSQILIKSSETEAREIRKKLEDRTASFEELARAHSKDSYAEKGGDAGWRYFYDLAQEFENSEPLDGVFKLEEGALSAVIKNRFGWVIYRCDAPALEPDLNAAETLKVVREYVMRYEKGTVEDYFMKKAEAFRGRTRDVGFLGATIEPSLKVGETEYFPLNYQGIYFLAPVRSRDEKVNLASASYNEDFFKKSFSLAPGQVSEPILLDDQVLVMRFDDVRQPPQQELDLMKDYYAYFARQSLETDLQNILLNPDYLKDDFNEVFYRYVFPKQ